MLRLIEVIMVKKCFLNESIILTCRLGYSYRHLITNKLQYLSELILPQPTGLHANEYIWTIFELQYFLTSDSCLCNGR